MLSFSNRVATEPTRNVHLLPHKKGVIMGFGAIHKPSETVSNVSNLVSEPGEGL